MSGDNKLGAGFEGFQNERNKTQLTGGRESGFRFVQKK
jgi:hypothetical protein